MPKPENILNPICPICQTRMQRIGLAKWKTQKGKKGKIRYRCPNRLCRKSLVFPRTYNVSIRKPRKRNIRSIFH